MRTSALCFRNRVHFLKAPGTGVISDSKLMTQPSVSLAQETRPCCQVGEQCRPQLPSPLPLITSLTCPLFLYSSFLLRNGTGDSLGSPFTKNLWASPLPDH